MDNPKIVAEGFTCEELAEALMVKLKPFIQESIREELAKMQEDIQPLRSNEKHKGQMTSLEPEVIDTGRYPSKVTAKILQIHPNTLLNHSKSGQIKCGISKANGRKFYTGSEIKRFWKASY